MACIVLFATPRDKDASEICVDIFDDTPISKLSILSVCSVVDIPEVSTHKYVQNFILWSNGVICDDCDDHASCSYPAMWSSSTHKCVPDTFAVAQTQDELQVDGSNDARLKSNNLCDVVKADSCQRRQSTRNRKLFNKARDQEEVTAALRLNGVSKL